MKKAKDIHRVVFVRHGESTWNMENRFTGWTDVPLTPNGIEEAKFAGQVLKEKGFTFDMCFTSVLRRAICTFNTIAEETEQHHIPVIKSWRLNERHYGGLQGLNKSETAAKHGEEQVMIWRRSYDIPPPELDVSDERHPSKDSRYDHLPAVILPKTESLALTVDRVLPFWFDQICPVVKEGKNVIVAAHGNSLRAIVKYLSKMSNEEIIKYNIPTATPFVYEFDRDMNPLKNYYLIDEETLRKKQEAVASQGKAK